MPVILRSVEDYVVNIRKRDTFWFVFNNNYNNRHAYKIENKEDNYFYLDRISTDEQARNEFLNYMKIEFPNVKLIDIFDLVDPSYVVYPFLGSILIECEKDDEVFNKLSQKYENPYEEAKGNKVEENYTKNVVFWSITFEVAKHIYDLKEKDFDQ